MDTFNVSTLFRVPGGFVPVPAVPIRERSTDVVEPYYQGVSRLYLLSEQYYGNPHYEQLLLLANPEWLSEFDIPDGTFLRIPFPLVDALQEVYEFARQWRLANQ